MIGSGDALDHFRNPRNIGAFPAGTPGRGIGVAGTPETGDMIRMSVRVAGRRIAEARFQAFGCSAAIAAASYLTELVRGLGCVEAGSLTPETVARSLGLRAGKERFARLAIEALAAALRDQEEKETPA